jgi:predicted GIY-YIG superfamily endonuclease
MNRTRKRLAKLPHDVYRIRDKAGALLYVGCSVNAFRRVKQHKNEYQPWFPLAATVDIEQYEDLATARFIEASAIAYEAPIWNTAQESRALRRGSNHLPLDVMNGIPVSDFWVNA